MTTQLQHDIKQQAPFAVVQEELWLNLSRTAATVGHGLEQSLRPFGLSLTQYNVLRILRGAGEPGLCQYEIRDRLVAQVPDVPRILDRMEKAGWVERRRGASDRRMVMTALTASGTKLVNDLDEPLVRVMGDMFPSLNSAEIETLNTLLVEARKSLATK